MQTLMRRTGITVGSLLLALAIGAATAFADIAVYSNPFSNKAAITDLEKVEEGRECAREWVRPERELALQIGHGDVRCVFATPVHGDAGQPAHAVAVAANVPKGPPKSARDDLAIVVGVRVGETAGYELRIVPSTREWELDRDPAGAGFPQQGSDEAIEGMGGTNEVVLQAFGDHVTAAVNGKVLVDALPDPAAGEVGGRGTTLGFVAGAGVKDDVLATFDDLQVRIPDPP